MQNENNYITNWDTNSTVHTKIKQGDITLQEELKLIKENYTGMHPNAYEGTLIYPLQSQPYTTHLSSVGKKKNHRSDFRILYPIPYTSPGMRSS